MLGAPGLMSSLGCASEGGFCCYLRVPGDLRAYCVRLGIQIMLLFTELKLYRFCYLTELKLYCFQRTELKLYRFSQLTELKLYRPS